jgi:Ca-activated chloride channel family protein
LRKRKEVQYYPVSPAKKRVLKGDSVKGAVAGAHLTIIGIGVDLSVNTVEKISSIQGAKYISLVNAAEFLSSVVDDFNYDVTPIAFNIKMALSAGLSFNGMFGSAELNSLKPKSKSALISAEFPVWLNAQGTTFGGLYVCVLDCVESVMMAQAVAPSMSVSWIDLEGARNQVTIPVVIPPPLTEGR